ncbi:MAG: hypothetical protein KJ574_03665 [Nanoarchaeota archaeon]|nr:hypothetical protein [Nanoarchaeota archaeon]
MIKIKRVRTKKRIAKATKAKQTGFQSTAQDYARKAWTRIKQYDITKMVADSFRLVFESWGLVALAALTDFIFLVLFSAVATYLQLRIFDHLYQLLMSVGESTGGLITAIQDPFSTKLSDLTSDPVFAFHLKQVLMHLLLMFLAVLVLWCIFECISWWLSHKIKHRHEAVKEMKITEYLGTFLISSLFFFLITLGLIWYFLQKYIEIGLSVDSVLTKNSIFGIYVACLVIVWYFGFMSYGLALKNPLKNIKESIVLGTKRIGRMLPTLLFLTVFYYVLLQLWTLLLNLTNNYIAFLYGVVIFIPSITFARVLFIKAADKLQKH